MDYIKGDLVHEVAFDNNLKKINYPCVNNEATFG